MGYRRYQFVGHTKTEKASEEAKRTFSDAVKHINASEDVAGDNKAFKVDEKKKAIDSMIGVRAPNGLKNFHSGNNGIMGD